MNAVTPINALDPAAPTSVVLVVDDVPQSLGALCIELDRAGYTVLVAADAASALARLDLISPDAILLDALMPGLNGFDLCRHIKANPAWSHIPVIFMTGLSDTAHIVRGFEVGGVDYVVKPLRAEEVLVRLATHVRNARAVRMARDAIDIGGHGVLMIDSRQRLAWRSPQAQQWLAEFFGTELEKRGDKQADARCIRWLEDSEAGVCTLSLADRTLTARRLGSAGLGEVMWLLGLRAADAPVLSRLATASLTERETEVLSWIAKGKTNRDVGEILGISARTVNKHLEHVFEKLGVETRSAAAALASRELG